MATPLAGQAPLEVTFTNCCSGLANCFEWTYGDDCCFECQHDYAHPVNPDHTYETEGTYDVTLKASGQGGEEIMTVANLIYVNEYAKLPLKLLATDGAPYNKDMDWG